MQLGLFRFLFVHCINFALFERCLTIELKRVTKIMVKAVLYGLLI